jgi:uncharacterized membrane protein YidH (DUF202 family)
MENNNTLDIERNNLALTRTDLASTRTFLSSIRTNSIFGGLVMILLSMKYYTSSILILICCIILQFYISYEYINVDYQEDYNKYHPIAYSILLIFILLIMLLTCIKLKFNIKD